MLEAEIAQLFRDQSGRVLATLIRLVGDFELAEEALQEAFAAALQRWPTTGIPANPRAWLVAAGRNKSVDRLRRTIRDRAQKREIARADAAAADPPWQFAGPDEAGEALGDDMLSLVFTCCHPALAIEARVALTLRTVCGLDTASVARAFLVSEETMAQRIVRAKAKIRQAGIPYAVPPPGLLDERLEGVLAVIYLVFNEAYAATSGDALMRPDLAREAIRLGRLIDALLPGRAAVEGLIALMLLHDARKAARVDAAGDAIRLEDQDRRLWDRAQIAEGLHLVETALRRPGRPAPEAVQAAIAGLHARAETWDATDWPQIVGLYQVLLRIAPTPVIELNHAAALSMVDGPAAALDLVDSLAARGALSGYAPLYGVRADLLRRLEHRALAREDYRRALALATLEPERRFYARRLAEIG